MNPLISAWRAWCARIADRRLKRQLGWETGWERTSQFPRIF